MIQSLQSDSQPDRGGAGHVPEACSPASLVGGGARDRDV